MVKVEEDGTSAFGRTGLPSDLYQAYRFQLNVRYALLQ